MKVNTKLTAGFVLLLIFQSAGGLWIAQPEPKEMLERKINDFQVKDKPTSLVLQRLARQGNLAIGIEAVPEKQSLVKTISVEAKAASLREVLNKVTRKDPQYRWQKENAVVNVYPRAAKDPILETVVARFQIQNVTKEQAISILKSQGEVRANLHGSRERTFGSLPRGSVVNAQKFSLDLRGSTVRAILNAILHASGGRYWIFSRYGSKNEFYSLQVE